jgi:hypothetical protein
MWFVAWGLAGAVLWLGTSYLANLRAAFYLGLLVWLILLVLCKRWFRPATLYVQGVNTLILVIVGLPAASLLLAPSDQPRLTASAYKGNSYDFVRLALPSLWNSCELFPLF